MIIRKVYGPDPSTGTEIQNAVYVFLIERRLVELAAPKNESDLVVDIEPVIPSVNIAHKSAWKGPAPVLLCLSL